MTNMNEQPHQYPVDGTLDLHLFRQSEIKEVVLEYLEECQRQRIDKVRIVHGKGIGTQRRIVHALLTDHPLVSEFRHEGASGGGWGATVVDLKL